MHSMTSASARCSGPSVDGVISAGTGPAPPRRRRPRRRRRPAARCRRRAQDDTAAAATSGRRSATRARLVVVHRGRPRRPASVATARTPETLPAVTLAGDAGRRHGRRRGRPRRRRLRRCRGHGRPTRGDGGTEPPGRGAHAGRGRRRGRPGADRLVVGLPRHPDLTEAAARSPVSAVAVAAASGRVPGPPLELAPAPVVEADWSSTWTEHPLDDVSLAEKGDLLVDATGAALDAGAPLSHAATGPGTRRSGSRRARAAASTSASSSAAPGSRRPPSATARRSAGRTRASGASSARRAGSWCGASTWSATPRAGDEAQALLRRRQCPAGTTTLILGSDQVALQIHESIGHAVELDRILGWEAAFAGTSWLTPAGWAACGSGASCSRSAPTPPCPARWAASATTTRAWPPRPSTSSATGCWVGVLSGRDSAPLVGRASGGMVRADGPARLPMVRMTNVGLCPGSRRSTR